MSQYLLLCNYTDQGIRTIKEVPKRRAAAREMAKMLGVDIKAAYLAMGTHDLILHVEVANDETLTKWVLSVASKGNVRTTTVRVFPEAEADKIVAALA